MDSKIIEEMAKIIFEKAFENYETSGSVEIDTEVRRHYYSAFLVYCEALYNAGYRKIPESAVVLTRERYEWLTCCFGKFEEIMNDIKKSVRKETAEKFAERVKMAFYYEFDELIPSIMADKIDEIAKEITGDRNDLH